jgi:hypothetical protein
MKWSRTGPKTMAYWCNEFRVWECLTCRALGERCDRARAECYGCGHLVPRLRIEGGWIHAWQGGHLTTEVATYPCTFHDDREQVATPAQAAA